MYENIYPQLLTYEKAIIHRLMQGHQPSGKKLSNLCKLGLIRYNKRSKQYEITQYGVLFWDYMRKKN